MKAAGLSARSCSANGQIGRNDGLSAAKTPAKRPEAWPTVPAAVAALEQRTQALCAGRWDYTDSFVMLRFTGRDCVIWPDRDEPGRQYAESVAEILSALDPPAKVRIIDPPSGLPEHGDVVDWLEPLDAKEPDELRQALLGMAGAACLPPSASSMAGSLPQPDTTPVLTFLSSVAPQPIRWLWPKRIAVGKLTIIAGDPGLGKSFLTLDMAARIAS